MEDVISIIGQMTLAEKASLCSGLDFWQLKGIDRLSIPSIMITDGPHGLRKQVGDSAKDGLNENYPATCFPTASALAATWNQDLVFQVGEALGEECLEEKVGVILGPGANIKRSPLCGRNFEYFSEDPYLTGMIAISHIKGVQSKGIGTSLKHFAVNNQEYRRMVIDAVIDERTLREVYLAGFEIAIKASKPWTVMCAYNKVNGTYCSEHQTLMTDILRAEWGYNGFVMTDWGAINGRVKGLLAGVELEMPGVKNGNDAKIEAAVHSGDIPESALDQAVGCILEVIFKAAKTLQENFTYDRQVHHALARVVAGEGAVLLKNSNGILPLKKDTKIALIGAFAKKPRYQGAGSSSMNPTQLDNIYDEVLKIAKKDTITYAPGYSPDGEVVDTDLIWGAIEIAEMAEVVVICAGLTDKYEVEGLDRDHMKLPQSHNALIEAVARVHSNIVVVLNNGAPVEMPWVSQVQAILEGYLGGQAGAGAIADILYGLVNPSGKLAETFPIRLEDNPSYHYFPGGPATVEYRESVYVGYRYYDTVVKDVLFPFGHGLSYTTYEYSDLHLNQNTISEDDILTVTLKVKNVGLAAGKEVVQLYVRDVESTIFRPDKELKGFEKVSLEPGGEVTLVFELDYRSFAYYDVELGDWHVESGAFEILIGASSRDIRLSETVQFEDSRMVDLPPDRHKPDVYSAYLADSIITKDDFENLYGSKIPANKPIIEKPYTEDTPISDMKDSFIGRQLGKLIKRRILKMMEADPDNPNGLMMMATAQEAPLRVTLMMGAGFTQEMVDGLLIMINGKIFTGLAVLVKAIKDKRNL
jgi:beta-glucosidase